MNFYKNKTEENLEIALLPQVFITEMKEIKTEIIKRKEFDLVFSRITTFVNDFLLFKEEGRRRE